MKTNEKKRNFLIFLQDQFRPRITKVGYAEKIAVSTVTVDNWIKGNTDVPMEKYLASLEILGVNEDEIEEYILKLKNGNTINNDSE